MNDEARKIHEQISDILRRWHRGMAIADQVSSGYPAENPSCRGWRASRQYDDTNGALDGDLEAKFVVCIDSLIHRHFVHPELAALSINARNLATGNSVWRSPRLPQDRDEAAMLTLRAREMLATLLDREGLL
jgi:hypothetical protein